MKVVILCGGKGTRLREETEFRPKPMVPIGEQPILWHIMQRFARFGHTDFVLCLGYKGNHIREYFESRPSGVDERWKVALPDTGQESMTGFRVLSVKSLLDDEPFFLTYGDGVGNINLNKLVAYHRKKNAVCTLTAVHPPGRFGEITFGRGGAVRRFNEKPQTETGYINGGFMVCEPTLFDYLPDDPTCMLEREPLQRLASEGKLAAYRHQGFWQPMDTPQEFALLNALWASGNPPWVD
jgi:glucose-1-phosphate cytidylyltransferase